MRLLCLSNGHGEDAIAARILTILQQQAPGLELAALPLVGEGRAYARLNLARVGPVKTMPSGGFVYMDGRQLARDIQGGLLQLTLAQFRTVRQWAQQGGAILAVGDILPLLLAWLSGAPYAFVGTAKSEYYLRDEQGYLPQRQLEGWSGSIYLPWERWLMRQRRCKAVFPRDTLTTKTLLRWPIPAYDLGNPMMDGLAWTPAATPQPPIAPEALTLLLLPGSRPPEAYANWARLLQAVNHLVMTTDRPVQVLAAIAPELDLDTLTHAIKQLRWHPVGPYSFETGLGTRRAELHLSQTQFAEFLHRADVAIAMAGTATEQFVGLGKPAITLPGDGPQFTAAFAEAQTRLLGPSVTLVPQPEAVGPAIRALLENPDRLNLIAQNGRRRLGEPGAAQRIAECLLRLL